MSAVRLSTRYLSPATERFLALLVAASAEHPTYQKTDTHWSSWGSLVAVRTLLDELRASGRFPGLAPLALADYRAEERLQVKDIAELVAESLG